MKKKPNMDLNTKRRPHNKIIAVISAVIIIMTFAGCSETADIDTDKLRDELLSSGKFTYEMIKPETDIAAIYGIGKDDAELISYIGDGGITAESLLICKAKDIKTAEKLKSDLTAYRDEQINIYSSYSPSDAEKLKSAAIEQKGVYVVYCVASESVGDIIGRYFN